FIEDSEKITIVNQDIFEFETQRKFDIITAFGVMQYLNEQESVQIYSKYKEFLKPNGKFIIKNQFGIHETVTIAGYSEEQKQNYYSQYRQVDKEKETLMQLGFKLIEINDIYPKEANRWACGGGRHTYFYALVAYNKAE
ncbi:MAG: class I SAM-dependent methyltransferase, partial [Helicobacter sp.]|nr:class I SAM-dependent methyltransferase [Helicobacter sp.]